MAIDTGDYVNDINIQEAVIHVLDQNADTPILNEYMLDLSDDTYNFLYRHIEKCLKDEELKFAVFNTERNIVKEVVQDYLNGISSDLIGMSKELSNQLFGIMKGNITIQSCDLIVVSIVTDQGPMVGLLKMDYVKNFTHQVDFVDNKIGIGIIPQAAGLPGNGQKIQKAVFIKPVREGQAYDLMVLDKIKAKEEEYGANYFNNNFLGCSILTSPRDATKTFMKATESWTRSNIVEDAAKAEAIRTRVKEKLENQDDINIEELSHELFQSDSEEKESFINYLNGHGIAEEIKIDKSYVEKKLKRVRLKIDKDIDLYINSEAYKDNTRFEIQKNGDGSINMVIKHINNYMEK
ncbi:nucleoid-associated protein [Clostridium gasigenes]|uniref:nucleoid-associated protein n=1 Tax=Clostridium gasigenes TaxID=94869 RepID=UPI00162914A4|nr:nucleoid-associated protein [Clostridium gasigenes]MBB6625244.1 nucleoid-associated protein [Clostridium gasigenes]